MLCVSLTDVFNSISDLNHCNVTIIRILMKAYQVLLYGQYQEGKASVSIKRPHLLNHQLPP